MEPATWTLLGILAIALGLFMTQVIRIEIVSLCVIGALALTGILTVPEALSGFSSAATITVAAMLVISAGLEKSGVIDLVSARLIALGRSGPRRLLLALCLPTAFFSAFMNNTPIVALMIPVAITLSRRFDLPASKLLMPISFSAILGGTCTLVGTSTNILVDSLYRDAGGHGFGMFEFTPMGVVYLIIGGTYILLLAPRSLPKRMALGELLSTGKPDAFLTEVRVPAGSRLVGRSISQAFQGAEKVTVLELVRDEQPTLRPKGETTLAAGDILLVESSARRIHQLVVAPDLEHGTVLADEQRVSLGQRDMHIAEAIVTPTSSFRYKEVRDLGLARKYGVRVLAVRRLGRQHQYNLRDLTVRSGDVLLLEGEPVALRSLQADRDLLLFEGISKSLTVPRKAPLAIAILILVVGLAAIKVAPIVLLALLGVAALLLFRCINVSDATRSLDASVLLLLAGTIPIGIAMQKTGLAAEIAGGVVAAAGPLGVVVVVSSMYLLTSLLTETLSNNAAAVLLTPIAIGIAGDMGVDPKPLLVAIAFGASASFATPIGYQTNTMVMGPGGYLFRDYLRLGLPLNILLWIAATALIPLFWPA